MNSIDKIYAQALIDISNDGNITKDTVKSDLSVVKDVISSSSELYSVLTSPSISFDKKRLILADVFSKNISKEVLNFLNLITEKNKFDSLNDIVSAFIELTDEIDGLKHVKVFSALEIPEEQKKQLSEILNKKLSTTVIPEWVIDEDVIGGLIIKYDDNVIDMSIKNKLDKIMKGNL